MNNIKKFRNYDYESKKSRPPASKSTINVINNNNNINSKQDQKSKQTYHLIENELMRLFFYGELSFQFYYNLTHFFLDSLGLYSLVILLKID